jgi:VWFA-related protein
MFGFGSGTRTLLWTVALACLPALGQQDIPDAPKPKVPVQQFPADTPPAPKNVHPDQPPTDTATTPQNPPGAGQPAQPAGQDIATDIRALSNYRVDVRFVEIPVTVKYPNGRLVEGLTQRDFAVFEDGQPQKLNYFNSQPFPLSVAVVVDTELNPETMKKINESLKGLIGAFSEFDEVALYRYGSTVQEIESFTGAALVGDSTLQRIKRPGRSSAPAAAGGTINNVPMINGHPADPGMSNPSYTTPGKEQHVLNDAVLRAANDLARHSSEMLRRSGQVRRNIVFVISDGRESGSTASYDEVRRVLLARNIAVYAIGVDTAAIPLYDRLNRIRIPGMGYGDLLPRYAVETGGQMYSAFSREAIEQAYARITGDAKNQYTLGFNTRGTPASNCHELVVNVHRPDLVIQSRPNYCPLPPQRQ